MTTTAERRAKSVAAWERRRLAGETGWTDARRVKFRETMAAKYPKGAAAARVRAAIVGDEVRELRTLIGSLTERIATLEARPQSIVGSRVVEWRPDHRRQKDGGKPVRLQRRDMGLPKRLSAVS